MVAHDISDMHLDGGIACLDFVNTAFDTQKGVLVERLKSYSDLIILTDRLELLSKNHITRLEALADEREQEASQQLEKVRAVRGLMFQIFSKLAAGDVLNLEQQKLFEFHKCVSTAFFRQALIAESSGLAWSVNAATITLETPLDCFLLSAYVLLKDHNQKQVKKCAGCEWLFLDETKNHRRKWCDMQTCGSAEKAKRYYRKRVQNVLQRKTKPL